MAFNSEQRRNVQNLRQFYETWRDVSRELSQLPGGMYWKVSNSREYLYKYLTTAGVKQVTSVGPRTLATEEIIGEFQKKKKDLQDRLAGIRERIDILAPIMKRLSLPAIDETAGRVLRAIDVEGYLGKHLLVIGTYAMTAYEMAAENRFAQGFDATEDLDFTMASDPATVSNSDLPRKLLLTLREVDRSFTVNIGSAKTVVNRSGYRVDLLISNELAVAMQGALPWKPEVLEGQNWLSLGAQLEELVIDHSGWPVMVVAPDPRYFALHKLWLSRRPKRIRERKAPKDAQQGRTLLQVIQRDMPDYAMDEAFVQSLPTPLKEAWEAERSVREKELTTAQKGRNQVDPR